jgi:hypothetical protein
MAAKGIDPYSTTLEPAVRTNARASPIAPEPLFDTDNAAQMAQLML